MLTRLIDRKREEEGFTLIELMVVVLIIGILIAIALPTFLGARSRAQDKAAQSSVRNAFSAAKTFFTDGDTYTGFDAQASTIEPSLTWNNNTASTGPNNADIAVESGSTLLLVVKSDTGTFYGLADPGNGPVQYCKYTTTAITTVAGCTGGW